MITQMEIVQSILRAVSPSVAAGIILVWWNHGQKKRLEREKMAEMGVNDG